MHISGSNVSYYIDANPFAEPVYVTEETTGNKKRVINARLGEVKIEGFDGIHYSVYIDNQKVVLADHENGEDFKFRLDIKDVERIKQWILDVEINNDLTHLLDAARTMVSHYNEALPLYASEKDSYRIDVYFLKHIDFRQDKGSVIIVPRPRSVSPRDLLIGDPHIIKGYVYNAVHESIRWETVQAWRYSYQEPNLSSGSPFGKADAIAEWRALQS